VLPLLVPRGSALQREIASYPHCQLTKGARRCDRAPCSPGATEPRVLLELEHTWVLQDLGVALGGREGLADVARGRVVGALDDHDLGRDGVGLDWGALRDGWSSRPTTRN